MYYPLDCIPREPEDFYRHSIIRSENIFLKSANNCRRIRKLVEETSKLREIAGIPDRSPVGFKGDWNMKSVTIMIAILLFAALNANAMSPVTCVTDKIGYYQGEQVIITITNNSSKDIEVPDIGYIDRRFARPAREIKLKIGRAWKAMIVIGTVDDIRTKVLKTNESHVYKLKLQTIDESMNETTSIPGLYVRPGIYMVFFHNEFKLFPLEIGSNEFTVKDNISTPNSNP